MTKEQAEYIRRVVRGSRGDDYERALKAFGGLTEKQMDEQHGQSGKTRRQLLAEYRADRQLWKSAVEELEKILPPT